MNLGFIIMALKTKVMYRILPPRFSVSKEIQNFFSKKKKKKKIIPTILGNVKKNHSYRISAKGNNDSFGKFLSKSNKSTE